MNKRDALQLVMTLHLANLLKFDEGQADVWASALDDVNPSDAAVATKQILRTRTADQRWVTPGDIRAVVKEVWAKRARDAQRDLVAAIPGPVRERGDDDLWLARATSAMRAGASLDQAAASATAKTPAEVTR